MVVRLYANTTSFTFNRGISSPDWFAPPSRVEASSRGNEMSKDRRILEYDCITGTSERQHWFKINLYYVKVPISNKRDLTSLKTVDRGEHPSGH
jgi:hypothetical protein